MIILTMYDFRSNIYQYLKHNHNWSTNKTNRCHSFSENFFLGGHCSLSTEEVSKTFKALPPHNNIRIQATFHMFDNWQGEFGYMKVNDEMSNLFFFF